MQVDAVHQRAAEFSLIAQHLVGRASAAAAARAQVAAGAGVHGGHQLKTRRKLCPPCGPRDGDGAGLQRLAQRLEGGAGELGQLVQKQHAMVRQRNLARPGRRAAAHQRDRAGRMVRAAGGALAPALHIKTPAQAADGGTLQRLIGAQGGQQSGKALRQHGLARAGRPHQ